MYSVHVYRDLVDLARRRLALEPLCWRYGCYAQRRLTEDSRRMTKKRTPGAERAKRAERTAYAFWSFSGSLEWPELEHNIHSASIHGSSASRSRSQINEIFCTHFFRRIRGRLACAGHAGDPGAFDRAPREVISKIIQDPLRLTASISLSATVMLDPTPSAFRLQTPAVCAQMLQNPDKIFHGSKKPLPIYSFRKFMKNTLPVVYGGQF